MEFRIYDVNIEQGVCFTIPNITREFLFPLIERFVQPRSIVTTEEAKVYTVKPL
jgi:hypothetical protein